MAFPQLRSESTAGVTAAGTSHSVPMPATIEAGDRLVSLVGVQPAGGQSSSFSWPAGWTELLDVNSTGFLGFSVAWRIADGTEDSTNVTVTTGISQELHHKTWCFSAAGTVYAGATTIAYGTNANPPNLDPGVGAKDFLWLALAVLQGAESISGFPASYSNTGSYQRTGTWTDIVRFGWARRELNASSEDPGAFTSATTERAGITVAIAPAEATITSISPTTINPGAALTINTSGFASAPTTVTLNGVSEAFDGAPSTTQSVMTAIPLTDFAPAGDHVSTRWRTNITLTVANGSESASLTVQIDPDLTPNAEDFTLTSGASDVDDYNPVPGAVGGDDFFTYWHTGDGVRNQSIAGLSDAGSGYMVPSTLPAQGRRMAYDVSAGAWLDYVDTVLFSAPPTLTVSDDTVTPGQTITLTLVIA